MTERIIIAGSGGQGIMLLGKILSEAAMRENKFVTWLPAYGAEVRGGTSHCMVVISDKEIGSPYIEKADSLIIMNGPSLMRFKKRVKESGVLIINSSLAPKYKNIKLKVLGQPFTGLAVKLGNIKVANMLALGFFLSKKKVVSLKSVSEVIQAIAPEDKKALVEINKKALEEGSGLK